MRGKYLPVALVVAVVVAATLYLVLPVGEISIGSPISLKDKNRSAAKQLALAAKLYAGDNGGKYPTYLIELAPDYLADLNHILYSETGTGRRFEPKYDWLYFAAGHDESHLLHIIIASPQAVTQSGGNQRIVVYGDQSAWVIPEDQYQRELHEMIDEMRKTPAPSHTGAPDSGGVPSHSGEKATAP
jgi:hypothetical protein